MRIDGYDVQDLPDEFALSKSGTLSLDADGLLYVCSHKVAKLETAVRRAKTRLFELQFLTKCPLVRAHLTARGCFKAGRHLLEPVRPYQSGRSGRPKPPMLEPLREALASPGVFQDHEGIEVYLHRDIEADDAIMQDAYNIPDCIVYSPDKDLRIVPCGLYDLETGRVDTIRDRYGWLSWDEAKGKIIGHGTAFFWAQMLMGDSADSVVGLQRYQNAPCGPVKAFGVLAQLKTEDDAANAVLDGYRAIGQNPLPEACCLWLLRAPHDTAEGYIWSLKLSAENRQFIQDCYNRRYRMEVQQEYEVQDGV